MKRFFVIFTIFFLVTGCRRLESNPEIRDPIYADYLSKGEQAKRELEKAEKELEAAKKQLEMAQVQTGEYKVRRGQVEDIEGRLVYMRQNVKYYEIMAENRMRFDKKTYLKAFNEDRDWPDPQEYKDYLVHQKLMEGPRSWDERLAKILNSRKPANASKAKTEKKPEAKE